MTGEINVMIKQATFPGSVPKSPYTRTEQCSGKTGEKTSRVEREGKEEEIQKREIKD